VIRPFLTIDRATAIEYCGAHDVPFADDPTNSDTRHARNRIRHELLPLLRDEYNPAIRDALVRLAGNAEAAVERVRTSTNPLIRSHLKKTGSNEWTLNLTALARLDATDLVVLFADLIVEHIGTDVDPSRQHFEELVRLVRNTRASGKRLSLPGLTVKREYEHLVFSRNIEAPATSATGLTTLTFPGETVTPKLKVTTEIIDGASPNSFACTKDTAYFSMRDLKLPLVIRGPEAGDRMRPFGLDGTKKLSDIFTDRKVPGRLRRKSFVVADAREIVWLVGVTTSESSRVEDPREPIVRITVETNTEDAGV
jgi:tRNA(Ile)-lysidine synthase